jgi:NlpC/P60 family putative phage cell wall peptidase
MTGRPIAEMVVTETLSWLGTPYRHQGRRKGVGCDCLGLVRGVYRAVTGREPETPPAYAADWAEASGAEPLLEAAERHLVRRPAAEMLPGDVILFRWRVALPAKHCAILTASDRFVHAYERSAVVETVLVPQWQSRITAAFAFPETPRT